MMDDIISENWRTPGLPIGNYYASLGNKYAYFYAAQCVNENPDKKWCHRFEVEESLLELLGRMKRLRVWIKNCIFHDRFSFNLPQNEPEVNIIIIKG